MGKSGEALSLVMPEDGGSLRAIERTLGVKLERASVAGIAVPELAATTPAPVPSQSKSRHTHGGAHRKNSALVARKARSSSAWKRGA